jgi:CDGSH-type Zn-finger protein
MDDEATQPQVRVTDDGPYEVVGVPIGRTHQIETEYGEPVDWAPVEPIPSDDQVVRLCRCGASSAKPICDDSCETADWDPVLTADRLTYTRTFTVIESVRSVYCGDRYSFYTGRQYIG